MSEADALADALEAEAVAVWHDRAGALAVALAAVAAEVRAAPALAEVVLQRGQAVALDGIPVLRLMALVGVRPVEVGTAEGCAAAELAAALGGSAAVAAGLLIDRPAWPPGLLGLAAFLWCCRQAGRPSLAVVATAERVVAALDAGADLAIAEAPGTAPLGLVAGRRHLVERCRALGETGIGRLSRPRAGELRQLLAALAGRRREPSPSERQPLSMERGR